MPVTLSGSAGQTGSLTLTDSELNNTITLSLAGSLSVVTGSTVPANSSDANWTTSGMFSTYAYKGSIAANSTGTSITWDTLTNALCTTAYASRVNLLYVKNLGASDLYVAGGATKFNSGTANSTTDYLIVPPYSVYMLESPMAGVKANNTSGLTFKTAANTTTNAYVVIGYNQIA